MHACIDAVKHARVLCLLPCDLPAFFPLLLPVSVFSLGAAQLNAPPASLI